MFNVWRGKKPMTPRPSGNLAVIAFSLSIATALAEDEYDGMISPGSAYHPTGGTFEEGFQASVGRFKEIFG